MPKVKPKYRKLKNNRYAQVLPSGKLKFISKAAAIKAGLIKQKLLAKDKPGK